MTTLRTVIVGAAGYSGVELVSILLGHPGAQIVGLFGSARREADKDGKPQNFAEVFPRFRNQVDLPLKAAAIPEILSLKPDAVFLATPHEASLELAPQLLATGSIKVFDLSAAFRLKDAALYPTHYGFVHTQRTWLEKAAYGLPELFRAAIAKADLIACPGCYPTSAILPLAPLVRAGAIENGRRPIIDSVSGVSGAGRSPALNSLFCEVSLQPYSVLSHRHNPEIDAYTGIGTVFTPHLGPYDRGILSTIHVDLAPNFDEAKVRRLLADAYQREPFVRFCAPGVWPAIADVRQTNFCDIGLAVDTKHRHLIIASAIDNLTKGAAGQAVQCMNIRFGLGETTTLLPRSAETEARR